MTFHRRIMPNENGGTKRIYIKNCIREKKERKEDKQIYHNTYRNNNHQRNLIHSHHHSIKKTKSNIIMKELETTTKREREIPRKTGLN